jgi:LysR family cyn operon transcriptional activator
MKERNSLELRHLRTFVVVAETENFTRAAERLGVSQPSISIQVKELEATLGAQLFARLGPRVSLTPAGRAFRERAELVLAKLGEAVQAVRDSEELVAGHLSLAVIPPLNLPWMPEVLGRLAREYPGLSVTLIEKSSDDLESTVERGHCDLGVGFLSHASPNLTYEVLGQDELVLLAAEDGPFGKRRSVRAEEVGEERLVVLPESYLLRKMIADVFRAARVLPRIALEVDTIDALLATVVESGLCTLMPRTVLRGREALGLRALRLEGWGLDVELGIVWPGDGVAGEPARVFAQALREVAAAKPRRRRSAKAQ